MGIIIEKKLIIKILSYLSGVVFFISGISKAFSFNTFIKLISNYNILPNHLISVFTIFLIITEITIGILFFFVRFQKVSAVGASVLLLGFLGLAIYAKSQAIDIQCGCFSFIEQQITSIMHFIQNIVLLLISISILYFGAESDFSK